MKRDNFIYIFFIVMAMFFIFDNKEVYAEPQDFDSGGTSVVNELTCLYEKGIFGADKVLLIQYSDGSRKIFKNEKDAKISDTGWYLSNANPDNWYTNVLRDSNGNLVSCPLSKETSLIANGVVTFYGSDYGRELLEVSEFKVIEPKVLTSAISGNGITCDNLKNTFIAEKLDREKGISCVYGKVLKNANAEEKCLMVQINYDGVNEPEIYTNFNYFAVQNVNSSQIKKIFDNSQLTLDSCPLDIFVAYFENFEEPSSLYVSLNKSQEDFYDGGFKIKNYELLPYKNGNKENKKYTLLHEIIEIKSCEDLFGDDEQLINMIKLIVNMVKIAIPMIIIVLGTIDLVQAVFAGSEDSIKKAQAKFIKRIIIGVSIFLVPSVLKLLLTIVDSVWGNIDPNLCGII